MREPDEFLFLFKIENIIHTFKFYYFDVPSEQVKQEVISFLVLNMHKFKDPELFSVQTELPYFHYVPLFDFEQNGYMHVNKIKINEMRRSRQDTTTGNKFDSHKQKTG